MFEQWLMTAVTHGRQMRLECLAKLYFAYRQGPAVVQSLLEQQIRACRRWLAELQTQTAAPQATDPFAYAVQQFRVTQIESFLTWLLTCQQAVPATVV